MDKPFDAFAVTLENAETRKRAKIVLRVEKGSDCEHFAAGDTFKYTNGPMEGEWLVIESARAN